MSVCQCYFTWLETGNRLYIIWSSSTRAHYTLELERVKLKDTNIVSL